MKAISAVELELIPGMLLFFLAIFYLLFKRLFLKDTGQVEDGSYSSHAQQGVDRVDHHI
jgi:hypothetical protein